MSTQSFLLNYQLRPSRLLRVVIFSTEIFLWRVLIIFPFSGSIKIFTVKENHSVQRFRYFATDRQTHRKTADLLLLLQRWRPKKLSCLDYEERYNYWYVLKKLHFPPFEIFIRWPTKKSLFFFSFLLLFASL